MKSTGKIVDAAIAEMPAEFTVRELGDYIVRNKGTQIKHHTLLYQINRAVKQGVTCLIKPNQGTHGAIYGKRNQEAQARLEDKWLNSTQGVREEGPMPPEVAERLFGKDAYAEPQAINEPRKTQPEPKPEAPKPPKVNGNNYAPQQAPSSAASEVRARLLKISGLVLELKGLSGFDLEAATANATDHANLKRLAQSAADMLAHFEAVLDVAAQAHIV